jgi:histone deacetylase 6
MEIDQPAPARPVIQNASQPVVRSSSMPPPKAKENRRGTGYVYDTAMMLHRHPTEDHPEMPNRISTIFNEMRLLHLTERMVSLFVVPVQRRHVMLVHSEDHWDKVEQLARK